MVLRFMVVRPSDGSWRGEVEQDLAGTLPVSGEVEGRDRIAQRQYVGKDRVDIKPRVEQRQRLCEFVVETEGADQRDLAGDEQIAGNAGVTRRKQTQLDDGAAAGDPLYAGAQPGCCARGLDRRVDLVGPALLVGTIGPYGRVAPQACATASASSTRSVTMTSAAPAATSAATTRQPIGPAPVTSTRWPAILPARLTACRATESGSATAARRSDRPSGSGNTCSAGTTRTLENPPWT